MDSIAHLPALNPGDCLLYSGTSFWSWVIRIKTWSKISHVEVYDGSDRSLASRDGRGVDRYPVRWKNLVAILRPKGIEQQGMDMGKQWFETKARGQAYDWIGLLCFSLAVSQGSRYKQFCSEFANRFYKHAGFTAFHPDWPSDKIAPGQFLTSPNFDWIWITYQP